MGTTQDVAGVGLGQQTQHSTSLSAAEAAEKLVGITLAVRAAWLPKAGNGLTIAPSDPAAANICRDMADGSSQEWKRLMTKKFCDQRDGVPTEALVADLELAIVILRARAPKFRVDRPLGALNAAETKAQARLDLAQYRLAESPSDPMVIQEALDARDHYAKVFGELSATLRHMLTVTRGTARRFVGRRRQLSLTS
jgi:hypothetical protein